MSRAGATATSPAAAATLIQGDRPAPPRKRALDRLAVCVETIAVAAIIVNIVVTFGNALVRFIFQQDFPWAADLWRILISIIAFLGAPAYFRRTNGMAYTALLDAMKGSRRQILQACGLLMLLCVCLTVLAPFPIFFVSQKAQTLPILGINSGFVAVWLGIGLVLMSVFTIEKLLALKLRHVLSGAVVPLLIVAATVALRWAYAEGHIEMDPFILIIPALILAFIAGVPIGAILALGGMLFFLITGDAPTVTFPSSMQYGIGSYILLAIPFFMLAGTLMEVTGMAKRMIDMVQEWVGHVTGGLLIAQIIGMYIFSGVSGSKAADVATVGSVMKAPLRQYGYPPTESVAVLAAAAAMGETIPPSLALLVLGSITTLSVGSLFVAGIIPAAVLAIALIVAVVIRSRIKGFHKGPPFSLARGPAQRAAGNPCTARARHRGRWHCRRHCVSDGICVAGGRLRVRRGPPCLPRHRMEYVLDRSARRDADRGNDPVHDRCVEPALSVHRHRRSRTHPRRGVRCAQESRTVPVRQHAGNDRDRHRAGRTAGDPDRGADPPAGGDPIRHRAAAIRHRPVYCDGNRRLHAAGRHRLLRGVRHRQCAGQCNDASKPYLQPVHRTWIDGCHPLSATHRVAAAPLRHELIVPIKQR